MATALETLRHLQELSERTRKLQAEYDEIVRRKPGVMVARERATIPWGVAPEPKAG
ncbi:MAG TPA: hypothetical protein VHG91_07310 [Longimicrobium sp.]|nr:hypothetical protein [Longimicrobium sp.]